MDIHPNQLPAFLDPLLSYLSDVLPHPAYSFLLSILSHVLALASALYTLLVSLLSTHPLQWDAQTVLPPLIALLTSYLAILSVYRTTTWMFRTSFFFLKWGTIFGSFIALASWILAQGAGGGNALAGRGLIGSLLLNMLNGEDKNAAGCQRSRNKRKSRNQRKPPPKAWDTWDKQREWQYQENEDSPEEDVLGNLMSMAGDFVRDGGWWAPNKQPDPTEKDKGKGSSRSR
ncbi:hypothetical protein MKEN_00670800 [Mycena kentingensis (nom. inval.)]|nr:hypothetical protein MKEN_00670800 [Mycena kentingensis (nom. inval.)]